MNTDPIRATIIKESINITFLGKNFSKLRTKEKSVRQHSDLN